MTDDKLREAVERACRRLYADQFTGDAPLLMEAAARLAERGAGQEPVAWMLVHPGCRVGVVETTWSVAMHKATTELPPGGEIVPLYAAPPPVAQPAATLRLTELLREAANALEACHAANVDLLDRRLAQPAVPEGWISDPDTIPKAMIDACANQILREFGQSVGTAGYYKRIIAATLAAAPTGGKGKKP